MARPDPNQHPHTAALLGNLLTAPLWNPHVHSTARCCPYVRGLSPFLLLSHSHCCCLCSSSQLSSSLSQIITTTPLTLCLLISPTSKLPSIHPQSAISITEFPLGHSPAQNPAVAPISRLREWKLLTWAIKHFWTRPRITCPAALLSFSSRKAEPRGAPHC